MVLATKVQVAKYVFYYNLKNKTKNKNERGRKAGPSDKGACHKSLLTKVRFPEPTVERENQLPKVVLRLPHMYTHRLTHIHKIIK